MSLSKHHLRTYQHTTIKIRGNEASWIENQVSWIENQVCVRKTSDTEREMAPSLKARDLTLIGSLPKPSNLEKYNKCCCINGKCKMSQLIRLCQEDPDIIINMYRISKSEDKCLPEIDLDAGAGQTYDSTEKLDEATGKKKYHYLMTDHSTTSINLDNSRQEPKHREETQESSFSDPNREITNISKPILRKAVRQSLESGGSNNTIIIRAERNSLSSTDDRTRNVIMIEPRISTDSAVQDSSHFLSMLDMVVKQQRQSITPLSSDEGVNNIERRCLNGLRCVPCVQTKKKRTMIERLSEAPIMDYSVKAPMQANELAM